MNVHNTNLIAGQNEQQKLMQSFHRRAKTGLGVNAPVASQYDCLGSLSNVNASAPPQQIQGKSIVTFDHLRGGLFGSEHQPRKPSANKNTSVGVKPVLNPNQIV